MPQTIDEMINAILIREGGFSNRSNDKGGPTKYGITQKTLSAYLGRAVSVDEIRNLPESLAREIMQKEFFYFPRLDMLPPALQPIVFDMSINHGPHNAITILQYAINHAGWGPVTVDGAMGMQTRNAAGKCFDAMGNDMINEIVTERENFFHAIVSRDPSQQEFLAGWIKRSESFKV